MRRPGQGASTGPRPGQRGSKSDTRLSAVSTARPGSTPAAVTIEPYECPDTALGSRHTGSVARWPGSARLCRGRIRGRQRAEGMNQRVPAVSGQYGVTAGGCHWWRHWRQWGRRGDTDCTEEDRDHCYVTSEAATDLGEVTEARRAVQPPVTRLQRPCSLAQPRHPPRPHPASLQPRCVRR